MGEESRGDVVKGPGTARLAAGALAVLALGAGAFALRGPLGSLGAAPASAENETAPAGTKLVSIPVEGMSCGACAARIKKTLNGLDGVTSVEVSLERRDVKVRYADGKVTPERIAAEVSSLGYKASLPDRSDAGEKTVLIPVDGMACESCVETVTNLLKGIDGVKDASVSLKGKEARVRFAEGKVTPEALAEAVTAQGFTAGAPRAEAEK